ncbi:hypothetical protein [Apis mellifera filamentous virus]|uniref:hypothetical protein n=1 Tax=Apis mellifera filamentous virus TaxID=1100043 RepID=UPI0006BD0A28|nr:hypothetical protein APL35_gp021 [Apis mellifera filamentous virus]AKY03090.1 hypothetical protein [Apis mellifera filamentous virus]
MANTLYSVDLANPDAMRAYPNSLFTPAGKLTSQSQNRFPRDDDFFLHVIDSHLILSDYQDRVLPGLVSNSPFLRQRTPLDVSTLQLNDIYVPIISVAGSVITEFSSSVATAYAAQDERFKILDNKLRLLVESIDSLTYWALQYRNASLDLLRLSDDAAERLAGDVEADRRFALRTQMLGREFQRLSARVTRADARIQRLKKEYYERFQSEIAQRDYAVTVLSQYLSNAVLADFDGTVSSEKVPPTAGRPIQDYLDVLIPLYNTFRSIMEEYNLQKRIAYDVRFAATLVEVVPSNRLIRKFLFDPALQRSEENFEPQHQAE